MKMNALAQIASFNLYCNWSSVNYVCGANPTLLGIDCNGQQDQLLIILVYLFQSIFLEKYITAARIANKPILPTNNAQFSSCMMTQIKVYNPVSDPAMKIGNLFPFRIETEYSDINAMIAVAAMRQAFVKLLCSVIEISNV